MFYFLFSSSPRTNCSSFPCYWYRQVTHDLLDLSELILLCTTHFQAGAVSESCKGKKEHLLWIWRGKVFIFLGRGRGWFWFFPPESLLYSASQILLNPCCFAYINTVSWLLPATRTAEGGCSRSRCRVQAVWPRCQCQRELLCPCWSARHRYWN